MPSLVSCSECSELIRSREPSCPFCGTARRGGGSLAYAAAAVLLGAAPVGCGIDDDDDGDTLDSVGEAAYGVGSTIGTEGPTTMTTQGTSAGATETDGADDSSSGSTGGTEGTGGTDTDAGSTSLEPDYGVPTTGG